MEGVSDHSRSCCAAVLDEALCRRPERLANALAQLTARVEAGCSAAELRKFTTRQLAALGVSPDWATGERAAQWQSAAPGRHLLVRGDPAYPQLLSVIPDPPSLLWVDGDPLLLGRPQLAVVGSRRASPGGRETARRLAGALAACGLVITSGLATGIDAAAHCGALDAATPTLAVFGCGIDHIYPAAHRSLAARIREQGALVSEFGPGVRPQAWFFPRRNRIISGLALGTLVVEAASTSGSLVTAKHALDQGREVFAVPGSILNPLSRGCHQLLRDGAVLTETPADVLAELRGFTPIVRGRSEPSSAEKALPALSPRERAVLASCDFSPLGLDAIVEECGLTASEVSSILTALEMKGVVSAVPGGAYVRTGKMPA
jgi:DNA processing protein